MVAEIDDSDGSQYDAYLSAVLLTAEQERELGRQAHGSDDIAAQAARWQLVMGNMRFVRKLALRYRKTVPLDDLLHDGALALYAAAGNYDPDLGYRFLTYAGRYVRQALNRTLSLQASPFQVQPPARAVARAAEAEQATPGALMAGSRRIGGKTRKRWPSWLSVVQSSHVSLEDANEFEANSLERSDQDPEQIALRTDLRTQIEQAMTDVLTARERETITLRFGLDGQGERTLLQLADYYGRCKETVRDSESRGLRKLSGSADVRRLNEDY